LGAAIRSGRLRTSLGYLQAVFQGVQGFAGHFTSSIHAPHRFLPRPSHARLCVPVQRVGDEPQALGMGAGTLAPIGTTSRPLARVMPTSAIATRTPLPG